MKNKRTLFLLMAVLLLTALTTPALAAGNKYEMTIEAQCSPPEIRVTVPSTAEVYINPFKMPVTINGEAADEQIVSTPSAVRNQSEVPVSVSATVTGEIKENSDMRLVSYSTIGEELTSKRAFVYFEMQPANGTAPDSWDGAFDEEKHIIVRTAARTLKDIVTLGADGEDGSYGAFRLTGDCVAAPKIPWTEADGIEVTIAFTFKPVPLF